MNNHVNSSNDDEFGELEQKFVAAIVCFMLWMFTAVAFGITFLEGDSGLFKALRGLLILSGFGFSYWMIYAKRGPGLNRCVAMARTAVSPFTRLPEKKRMALVLPVFSMAVVYTVFTAVWLIISDEAAQKRALFNTYDGISDVQWFHHGDSIDLYVYSETLDTLYEDALTSNEKKEANLSVGVRIRYDNDLMQLSRSEFATTIHEDIAAARTGKLNQAHGKAEFGVHDVSRNPYQVIVFHGAFGISGYGFPEILLMLTAAFGATALGLSVYYRSYYLLGMSALLLALAMGPHITTPDIQQPQVLEKEIEGKAGTPGK